MDSGTDSGNKQLHFRHRFRGATKGLPRPTIVSMDWYKHSGEFEEMMAFTTGDWIRAFGRKGSTWEMLVNRKPSGIRKVNVLKWSPEKCSRLAVASTNWHHVTIDLLDFEGGSFKKVKRFEVPQASCASCLSWNFSGKYLLVPMKRDAQYPEARMVVFRILGNKRYSEKAIFPKYGSSFTAVFHPASNIILSTSVKSSNIDVYAEDSKMFDWTCILQISCVQGVTNMCIGAVHDGFFIAASVRKSLMIWKYCDKDDQGANCHPRLEIVNHVNDDGIPRRKDVSLLKHCDNILSLSWSSAGQLLTGSTMGTMCVHALHRQDKNIEDKFDVLYYRWSYVHAKNTRGPVTCVSWIPMNRRSLLALAGNDGVVIVWELMDPEVPNPHDRNYIKEINYFHPGRKSSVGEAAQEFDVASIESIMATQSDAEGEGTSGASEDRDEDEAEQVVSTPVNSRVRKVLETQADLQSAVSEVVDNVQDVIVRLSALAIIADEGNDKISDLTVAAKDAEEKLESIEESVVQLSEKLQVIEEAIKTNRTELDSAVKEVILPRLTTLEAAVTQGVQKPVDNAEMTQKEKLELLLSKADAIDNQLKSIVSQYYKVDTTLLVNKNHLERSVIDRVTKMDNAMHSKQNDVEQTLMDRLRQAEECMQSRLNTIQKENQERHTEMILRFDTLTKLLQNLGNKA